MTYLPIDKETIAYGRAWIGLCDPNKPTLFKYSFSNTGKIQGPKDL